MPQVHVAEPILQFPSTFIGTTHTLPLTLVNTTPVTATLMCDLMQLPEFELHLSREAWSNAGYTACPVKRIGANGEMSAVGSTRVSRRCTGCVPLTASAGLPGSAGICQKSVTCLAAIALGPALQALPHAVRCICCLGAEAPHMGRAMEAVAATAAAAVTGS